MPALRLKPHLAAHVVSPEEGGPCSERAARYALRAARSTPPMVPLLDGKRSDDDIAARLRGASRRSSPATRWASSKPRLRRAGRDADGETRAADTWWSGRAVAPPAITARLIDAGAYRPALAALRKALGASRSTRRKTSDLVVIATSDYLDERLENRSAPLCRERSYVLPARLAGDGRGSARCSRPRPRSCSRCCSSACAGEPAGRRRCRVRGRCLPLLPVQGLPLTFDLAATRGSPRRPWLSPRARRRRASRKG